MFLLFFSATEWSERNMGFTLYLSWVFDLRQVDLKENTHPEKKGWMIWVCCILYILYILLIHSSSEVSSLLKN